MSNRTATQTLAYAYTKAKLRVLTSGFGPEIIWQKNVRREELTEAALLRESAWVIISSGMRESVVRRKFPQIGAAFFNWTSARQIVRHRKECVRTALRHFHHEGKIEAIARSAQIIDERGFQAIRKEIQCDPISVFRQFPYMGPVTSFHLAKNIGFPVVKPDRHLIRLAARAGYERPADFCNVIAEYIGDPVSVVDIVLWRYATLHRNYLMTFLPVGRGNA